jgi:hypothetical protein
LPVAPRVLLTEAVVHDEEAALTIFDGDQFEGSAGRDTSTAFDDDEGTLAPLRARGT